VLNLFFHCGLCDMPVTFHIGCAGDLYGLVDELGLPRLEKVLRMFPGVTFLGHSQKFWSEIGPDVTEETRGGYPKSRVLPGGRIVELLRRYPNLCGDLSASSGSNALMRDPEFGYSFIEEFQDRLFFGTDIADPDCLDFPMLKLASFLDEAMEAGHISPAAYEKVCRGNALRLLERDA
jgi:predicted TIM-barrel fold metal-dependent hydrolase